MPQGFSTTTAAALLLLYGTDNKGVLCTCRRKRQYDVVFVDQVSAAVPVLRLLTNSKVMQCRFAVVYNTFVLAYSTKPPKRLWMTGALLLSLPRPIAG